MAQLAHSASASCQAFADLLPERLDTLLAVIYLIFKESLHGEQESASRRGSNLSREQSPWKPTERPISILAHN